MPLTFTCWSVLHFLLVDTSNYHSVHGHKSSTVWYYYMSPLIRVPCNEENLSQNCFQILEIALWGRESILVRPKRDRRIPNISYFVHFYNGKTVLFWMPVIVTFQHFSLVFIFFNNSMQEIPLPANTKSLSICPMPINTKHNSAMYLDYGPILIFIDQYWDQKCKNLICIGNWSMEPCNTWLAYEPSHAKTRWRQLLYQVLF